MLLFLLQDEYEKTIEELTAAIQTTKDEALLIANNDHGCSSSSSSSRLIVPGSFDLMMKARYVHVHIRIYDSAKKTCRRKIENPGKPAKYRLSRRRRRLYG